MANAELNDISGFGLTVRVLASKTFPVGFTITSFPGDTDPFDLPEIDIAEWEMGLNGDLITWAAPNPIECTLAVTPRSDDDKNLAVLFEANRTSRGKRPARDQITLIGVYPDDATITLSRGKCTRCLPGVAVASSGRMKTMTYSFVFEQCTKVGL